MAGRIPPDFIGDLLARTDVVELINSRVSLRKTGKDYQACCPFHDEKTPSFTVSREKQFYHCFGCGAHGSAIGFLMEYEHQGFREAVEELARQAGMELPAGTEAAHGGPAMRPLYDLLEQTAALYRRELRQHPEAHRAVDYLKGRGLSGKVAATFGLGFAPPGWDFLLSARRDSAPPDPERLLQCGLTISQDGKRYDRFRDRIMFPIRDRRGRVIGFGGRVLGDQKPKYLNSPETPVFHKGRELYGLYEAQQANRRLKRLLVVEGYMDVIALAQFGITYAVATLGTATTPEHLRTLLRSAPELVFSFDGDHAGRDAAWKALQTVLPLATGRQQVRFLFVPEGEDPDTLIRQEGGEEFEQRLRAATPLSEFLFAHLSEQVDMSSLDGRARLATLAAPLLEQVPSGLFRDMLNARLAELVGIARNRLGAGAVTRGNPARRRAPQSQTSLNPLRLAVCLLLQHPNLAERAHRLEDNWKSLDQPGIELLGEILDLIAVNPEITTGALVERWREKQEGPYLLRLADPALLADRPAEGLEEEFAGALGYLNKKAEDAEFERLCNRGSTKQLNEDEKRGVRHYRSDGPREET
jgi:DNA primase